jgi:hypothetical protein
VSITLPDTEDPGASSLDGFLSRAELELFLSRVPDQLAAFDIVELEGHLWPHLYLIEVGPRGELIVVLVGDHLRDTFRRDLRSVDLRGIVHGPGSGEVVGCYDLALERHARVAMRRSVDVHANGVSRIVECAFAPLLAGGRVEKIIGCLFFHEQDLRPLRRRDAAKTCVFPAFA